MLSDDEIRSAMFASGLHHVNRTVITRWKDGIDIDFPIPEVIDFARSVEHAAAREIERLRAERDNARARFELAAKLLTDIHALLYLPPTTLPDGRTFVFRPENPDPHTVLQTLSDRIRALPDEIAAINEVKEQL